MSAVAPEPHRLLARAPCFRRAHIRPLHRSPRCHDLALMRFDEPTQLLARIVCAHFLPFLLFFFDPPAAPAAAPAAEGAGSAGRPTTAAGAGAGPAAARFLRSGCSCSSWLTALYSALPAEAAHAASGHTSALALPCRGRARFGTSGLCGMSSSVRITTRRRPRSIVGLREYALSCAETGARRTRLSARAGGDAAPPSAAGGGSVLKHAPRTARVFAGW